MGGGFTRKRSNSASSCVSSCFFTPDARDTSRAKTRRVSSSFLNLRNQDVARSLQCFARNW